MRIGTVQCVTATLLLLTCTTGEGPHSMAQIFGATHGRELVIQLVLRQHYDHIYRVMGHRPSRKVFALFLGVFMALGMSLSAVQAGSMAVKMSLATDMGASEQSGCGGCSGDGGAQMGTCHPVCTVAAVAVLPLGPVVATAQTSQLPPPPDLACSGRGSSPDPSPPRAD